MVQLLCIIGTNYWTLVAGKVILSFGVSMSVCTVLVYITEISPAPIRGTLVSVTGIIQVSLDSSLLYAELIIIVCGVSPGRSNSIWCHRKPEPYPVYASNWSSDGCTYRLPCHDLAPSRKSSVPHQTGPARKCSQIYPMFAGNEIKTASRGSCYQTDRSHQTGI